MVDVTVTDFCALYQECSSASGVDVILAFANPSQKFPLIDDDGVVRLYPQAVVRQMTSLKGEIPHHLPSDILMEVNSQANFWFQYPNTTSIRPDQYDFLTVAIHECVLCNLHLI